MNQDVLAHLEDLWVVVNLALVAALAYGGGPLGEIAALVQQEQRLAVLLLQALQLPSVLPMDGRLGGQDEVAPRPGWGRAGGTAATRTPQILGQCHSVKIHEICFAW